MIRRVPLRRHVPLRRRLPSLCLSATRQVLAPPATPPPVREVAVVRAGPLRPQPARDAEARIVDLSYLLHLRRLACFACDPGAQVTQTTIHHEGPRPVGRKTHDWLGLPLCWLCHRRYHRTRTLSTWSIVETARQIRRAQLLYLCNYFAGPLRESAGRWAALVDVADALSPVDGTLFLRRVLAMFVALLRTLSPGQVLPPWEGPDVEPAERAYLKELDAWTEPGREVA